MKRIITFIAIGVLLSLTSFGQISWGEISEVASSDQGKNRPRIVTDRAGNPLVIWGNKDKLTFSRWMGTKFSEPINLNPDSVLIAEEWWMGPNIASFGDTVYVVYKELPENSSNSHIWCLRSFDAGKTFQAPVQVDIIGDSLSRFATVSTDNQGNPLVAFMKFSSSHSNPQWAVARSNDFGATFSKDVLASGWSNSTTEACDCCPGVLTSDGNNVAMLYRDNDNNIRDSWAGVSSNSGASFYAGMSINEKNWELFACPSSGPDGVIVGDTIYSTSMNGGEGKSLVYFNKSSISDLANSAGEPIVGQSADFISQNFPRIDRFENAMAVVWKQTTSTEQQLPILYTPNLESGFTAPFEVIAHENISNPDVALYKNKVWVVWQDNFSGTVKYRFGSYTPVGIGSAGSEAQPFRLYPNPAEQNVYLQFNDHVANNPEIIIRDALGKIHMQETLNGDGISRLLDISTLNPGMYFVSLHSEGYFTTIQQLIVF